MSIDVYNSPEFATFAHWLAQRIEPDQWHTFSMRLRAVEGSADTAEARLGSAPPEPLDEGLWYTALQHDERAAFEALMSTEIDTPEHLRADSYLAGLRHALAIFENQRA
jgi:hypothetical protein